MKQERYEISIPHLPRKIELNEHDATVIYLIIYYRDFFIKHYHLSVEIATSIATFLWGIPNYELNELGNTSFSMDEGSPIILNILKNYNPLGIRPIMNLMQNDENTMNQLQNEKKKTSLLEACIRSLVNENDHELVDLMSTHLAYFNTYSILQILYYYQLKPLMLFIRSKKREIPFSSKVETFLNEGEKMLKAIANDISTQVEILFQKFMDQEGFHNFTIESDSIDAITQQCNLYYVTNHNQGVPIASLEYTKHQYQLKELHRLSKKGIYQLLKSFDKKLLLQEYPTALLIMKLMEQIEADLIKESDTALLNAWYQFHKHNIIPLFQKQLILGYLYQFREHANNGSYCSWDAEDVDVMVKTLHYLGNIYD